MYYPSNLRSCFGTISKHLSALFLLLLANTLSAQNAQPGCDKYTMLISENNKPTPITMALPFPTTAGQMPTGGCDLGAGAGGDGIAIDPVKNIGYLAVPNGTGIIKVYNYATGTFLPDILISGQDLLDVILSPDGQYLYVTTYNGIYKISTTTNAIVGQLTLQSQDLWGIAWQTTTNRIYFSQNWFEKTQLSSIQFTDPNLGTPTTAFTAPTGYLFRGITFAADGTIWAVAYNSAGGNDLLYHFSVNTNGTLSILNQYDFPGNTNPFDIAIGPDGNLYITTWAGACVYSVNPTTGVFTTYIPYVAGSRGKGIAFVCGNFKCPCSTSITMGTVNTTSTCNATDATATITGIGINGSLSNSVKADIKEGSTYGTTPVFGASTNLSVTNGSITFYGLKPSTTYTVRVWNGSDGCYNDKTFTTAAMLPKPIVGLPDQSICPGEIITFGFQGQTGLTYLWNTGATSSTISVSPTFTTSYIVTVTATATTCSAKDTVKVTVNPKPNAGLDVTSCQSTIKLNAAGTGETWSFLSFNNPNIPTQTGTASIDAQGNVSGMTLSGFYRFVLKNSFGCPDTIRVQRRILTLPNITLNPVCEGTTLTFGYTNTTDFTYSWNTGQTTGLIAVTPTQTTDYIVTATEIATGCTVKDTTTATVKPKPTITLTSTICAPDARSYTVSVSVPSGTVLTSNAGIITGSGTVYSVKVGADTTSYTITADLNGCKTNLLITKPNCVAPKGSLGDYVWKDSNNNGIQDAGEVGVDGVTIELYKNGTLLTTTTTAGGGKYLFSNLDAGTYYIKVVASSIPAGCVISTMQNQGADDAKDSDVSPTTGQSGTYTIDPVNSPATKDITTVDAALYSPKGSLGDYVWKDSNNNGIQDAGEAGVDGVTIELYKNGTLLTTTTTSGGGKYLFSNLDAGTYYIKVVSASIPAGCVISTMQNQGADDAKDSDVSPTTGQSGTYTIDPVNNPTTKDITTVDVALYSPKGSLGDYVWKDANNNGIQDAGEAGVDGVTIELYKNGTLLTTTTTAGGGKYLFSNLDAGTYYVKVVSTSIPAGCVISTMQNQGADDAKDSDVSPTTGQSGTYTIDPVNNPTTKDITTVDAALYSPKGSLGDYVWKDANNNGIQDVGEAGVDGVIIELYKNGTLLTTTTTAGGGKYLFSNLDAGTYYIKVLSSSIPAGCVISTMQNQGADDAKDSDVSPTTGQSGTYTIDPVNSPTTKDVTTVDAAFAPSCILPNFKITTAPTCNATSATYSVNFTVSQAGIVKVNAGMLSGSGTGPYTVSNIPSGINLKITDSLSATCKKDTIINSPNCSCPKTIAIVPSYVVCKGDTLPTLKVSILGTGATTAEWYTTPTGGTPIFTGLSYKPAGIAATNLIYYVMPAGVSGACLSEVRTPILINVQDCTKETDLALTKMVDKKSVKVGDLVTFTIKVWNESSTPATGVEVTDQLPVGLQYVSSVASRGNYTTTTGIWKIGNIAAAGDTVKLQITARVLVEGVTFNTAEITKADQKDKDSTPGNGVENEDDLGRACVSVPIKLCLGQVIDVTIPSTYTGIVWKDAQGNIIPSSGNVVTFTKAGTYSFTATNGTCPTGGCCPVVVEEINCCPTEICIPFTITKKKK